MDSVAVGANALILTNCSSDFTHKLGSARSTADNVNQRLASVLAVSSMATTAATIRTAKQNDLLRSFDRAIQARRRDRLRRPGNCFYLMGFQMDYRQTIFTFAIVLCATTTSLAGEWEFKLHEIDRPGGSKFGQTSLVDICSKPWNGDRHIYLENLLIDKPRP